MKLAVVGATGLVGGQMLQALLADPTVAQVHALTRRDLNLHQNTGDYKLAAMTDTGGGEVQEKVKVLLSEILAKVNDLFDGELTEHDMLAFVDNIKGKMMESDLLVQQAMNNTKEQFSNSPDFTAEQLNAIIDAFDAFSTMSKQALDSDKVRQGLKHILLGPAELYESLRSRGMTSRQAQ